MIFWLAIGNARASLVIALRVLPLKFVALCDERIGQAGH
jgi:hypothetical protein